jgi:hypothetical protein
MELIGKECSPQRIVVSDVAPSTLLQAATKTEDKYCLAVACKGELAEKTSVAPGDGHGTHAEHIYELLSVISNTRSAPPGGPDGDR